MQITRRILGMFVERVFRSAVFRDSLRKEVQRIVLCEPMVIGPSERFHMADKASSNNLLANTYSGHIWIEDHVFFGKNVCLITGSHDFTKFYEERRTSYPQEGNDIIIRRGAWIATNATILGPCVVGENAVVAAGSVVTKDVPEYTVVAGVPAKVIKHIAPFGRGMDVR